MTRSFLGNAAIIALLLITAAALAAWQDGSWWLAAPTAGRWAWAGAALAVYALACTALWWWRRPAADDAVAAGQRPWLIAWASQTGFAAELAQATASQLRDAGKAVRLRPLEQVDGRLLADTEQALFIAATTGEGDAPDHALGFVNGPMASSAQLAHLRYAVLALGDRSYTHYCAMGRRLDAWLQAAAARPLFACIDVDNADASALTRWQQQLAMQIGQRVAPAPWAPLANQLWQLRQRRLLNRGSQGGPVYHLQLEPADGVLPDWQAGDIALIPPRNSANRVHMWMQAHGVLDATLADGRRLSELLAAAQLPQSLPAGDPAQWIPALPLITPREYSIASMPGEGHLALLLRRHTGPDGQPGLGSAWMCDVLQPGDPVQLRLRSNPAFHPPAAGVPLILIGNGTGLAGLRAQLRARIEMGARRNWLLFGERSAATDFHFQQDLEQWLRDGWLEQLDTTFSRDGGEDRHVQHRLARHAGQLKQWLDQGAVVMVCGSLKGMAPDVDAVITRVIGSEGRDALLASGRYRRDVY